MGFALYLGRIRLSSEEEEATPMNWSFLGGTMKHHDSFIDKGNDEVDKCRA
jgi:hypothetical protein